MWFLNATKSVAVVLRVARVVQNRPKRYRKASLVFGGGLLGEATKRFDDVDTRNRSQNGIEIRIGCAKQTRFRESRKKKRAYLPGDRVVEILRLPGGDEKKRRDDRCEDGDE